MGGGARRRKGQERMGGEGREKWRREREKRKGIGMKEG